MDIRWPSSLASVCFFFFFFSKTSSAFHDFLTCIIVLLLFNNSDIPQIEFRTYNQPWLNEMERFMSRVLQEVEPFLARNGGPIILAQVEVSLILQTQIQESFCVNGMFLPVHEF
jgi:hypothetical protein